MKTSIKLLCLICLSAFSLSSFAQKPMSISGRVTIANAPKTPVKLFKVNEGKLYQIAESDGNVDGKFGFYFYPEYEGFYAIGFGSPVSPSGNFTFYGKQGDHLEVEMNFWGYKLLGDANSKENQALYAWHQFSDSIYTKSVNFMRGISTYVDFFPQLEDVAAKVHDWLKGINTGNPEFDGVFPRYVKLDLAMIACNFLQTPRSAHPKVEEYSPYYSTFKASDFTKTTDLIYQYPYGIRTLSGLSYVELLKAGSNFGEGKDMVELFGKYIINDTLKGDIALNDAANARDYTKFKDLVDKYDAYILTDSQMARRDDIMQPLLKYKKGDDAYQFEYEDNHGKKVSLADLKGKVVLVDVWATWCGPCKVEIPYLKKLEEEMKGKDVQIVSISVDEVDDKDKWLNYIDTAKLGGIQLFAGGWDQNSGIARYYNIKGIPRFMVFDKNGKIVTVDSPRPSNPALKELLEEEAAK